MAMLNITQGGRPPRPAHPAFKENLWALMKSCWDQNPRSRPGISEVLQVLLTWSVSCAFRRLSVHQPDYLPIYSEHPFWKRLITDTLTTDERISLITTIFLDKDQIEMVRGLSGVDAQTFVDTTYEASSRATSHPSTKLIVFGENPLHLLTRCWMTSHQTRAKIACLLY